VRAEALGDVAALSTRLDNSAGPPEAVSAAATSGLQRVSDVPIYASDPMVRRAASLQRTADAHALPLHLPTAVWQSLGLQAGDRVRVTQGTATQVLPAALDARLAADAVRVAAAHPQTTGLGPMFGPLTVEKA
jgi:NADH-quinone oxidoreductase subunit G